MTTTANLGLTNLEAGQGNKLVVINGNMAILDANVPKILANAASDPATTGLAPGSMYYNTTSKVTKRLVGTVWKVLGGFQGDAASDPATTNLEAGSTYFNTTTSKLKVLRPDGTTWSNVA